MSVFYGKTVIVEQECCRIVNRVGIISLLTRPVKKIGGGFRKKAVEPVSTKQHD